MENAFTILPMGQNFALNPGETTTGKITIVNPAESPSNFTYSISVSPYNVIGEDYRADITTVSAYSQIAEWITILEPTGTITPNEAREVEFAITVPEDANPGGQYAAIIVSSDQSKQDSEGVSINNVFALASIIYADVSGEVTHEGTILQNNVPEFAVSTPISVSGLLDNRGNTHETAIFALTVTNNFTGEKILPTDEGQNNRFSEIVMPETTRYINRNIDNLPTLGSVKIEQTIYYNNEVSTVTKDVLICPIWFLCLIALVIFSTIGFITFSVRHHHKKATI